MNHLLQKMHNTEDKPKKNITLKIPIKNVFRPGWLVYLMAYDGQVKFQHMTNEKLVVLKNYYFRTKLNTELNGSEPPDSPVLGIFEIDTSSVDMRLFRVVFGTVEPYNVYHYMCLLPINHGSMLAASLNHWESLGFASHTAIIKKK